MTLDQDLALPQRHQAAVLSLLLVAHVAVNLGLEIKPEKYLMVKKYLSDIHLQSLLEIVICNQCNKVKPPNCQ